MLKNTNDPVMERAVNVICDLSSNEEVRELARQREKALHDEASLIEAGIQQGIDQATETMTNNMKLMGMSEEIDKTTSETL